MGAQPIAFRAIDTGRHELRRGVGSPSPTSSTTREHDSSKGIESTATAARVEMTTSVCDDSVGVSSAASASGRLREFTSWLSRSLRAVLVVRPDTGAADQPPAATRVPSVATQ